MTDTYPRVLLHKKTGRLALLHLVNKPAPFLVIETNPDKGLGYPSLYILNSYEDLGTL